MESVANPAIVMWLLGSILAVEIWMLVSTSMAKSRHHHDS